MPELPEVETIVRQLVPLLAGRRVAGLDVFDPRLGLEQTGETDGADGAGCLAGAVVTQTLRLGKQIAIGLALAAREHAFDLKTPDFWIVVHLRMTGRLLWMERAPKPPAPPSAPGRPGPLRALLRLEGGAALAFSDARRLGTVRLARGPEALTAFAPDGLDPTSPECTARRLFGLTRRAGQPVKTWLLRQDRLCGVGNIYASEALFAARLSPARPAGSLAQAECARLRASLRRVLARAIAAGGTTFSDFQNARGDAGAYQKNLRVYGREGLPCPRCGAPIRRLVQQQRSTFYCPACQA